MSLVVINGSPRGKNSNSSAIIEWFMDGYNEDVNTHYLNKIRHHETAANAFEDADKILCVFPLYVDGMPGQVKAFFESLEPFKGQCQNKSLIFIIHSGFSEAVQNRALETYLNRLGGILKAKETTVVIMPGSEGFRLMPEKMIKKKKEAISQLGASFRHNAPLNQNIIAKLQKRERFDKISVLLINITNKLNLTNFYWNQNLKANNAYEKRFDAPYSDGPVPVTTGAYLTNQR